MNTLTAPTAAASSYYVRTTYTAPNGKTRSGDLLNHCAFPAVEAFLQATAQHNRLVAAHPRTASRYAVTLVPAV